MHKIFSIILIFFLGTIVQAQKPEKNATLYQTHIAFEWTAIPFVDGYIFVLKDDAQKTIASYKCTTNALLITDKMTWGKQYYWMVYATKNKKQLVANEAQSFSIASNKISEVNKAKFTILNADKKLHGSDLIFIENLGTIIDRKGNVVWYLNKQEGVTIDDKSYRSMQMHKDGFITFIGATQAYEVDINGNLNWVAPSRSVLSSGENEEYHHHFDKTSYGTYLCASYYYEKRMHPQNATKEVRVRYNTIIEFDELGSLVWSWNEKDAVDDKVLFEGSNGEEAEWAGTHMNGFVYDEKNSAIIVSCRNSSQVFVIDYLSKKIIHTWKGKPGKFNTPKFTFIDQHGPALTKDGNILVYNNNIYKDQSKALGKYPTIQLIESPFNNKNAPMLWEYSCAWNKKPDGIQTKEGFVKELENKNFLVCVGGTERIFEVNKTGNIVWECTFEKAINEDSKKIVPFANYRSYSTTYLHPNLFGVAVNKNMKKHVLEIINYGLAQQVTIVFKTADGLSEIKRMKAEMGSKVTKVEIPETITTLSTYYVEVISLNNKNVMNKILVQ